MPHGAVLPGADMRVGLRVGTSTGRGIGHKSANPFHSFHSDHPLKQAVLFHFSQEEMMAWKHQEW